MTLRGIPSIYFRSILVSFLLFYEDLCFVVNVPEHIFHEVALIINSFFMNNLKF